ncbi:DUF2970 domain-containing protein [Thalassotalea ponticola]|uniref:DUF2970 domain-containing protein n=1 Tax=Thalassotalea ponticola TaxID=1523392 RepID=UPI0025B52524|nr:DUF2970 domain-containing protein [Thalassotalea ponticola]MDN3652848.1 DUF2970 domain-containing protein [Thalassotalea ponticola]
MKFRQLIGSLMAALIGVQSERNRQRDFYHGKASHFVIAGVIGVVIFVVLLLVVVRTVISVA